MVVASLDIARSVTLIFEARRDSRRIGCEIEAKVSEVLAAGGMAGPDMAAVKGLLVQLVKLIEHGRAAAKTSAPIPQRVSLESDIMAEITAAEPSEAEQDPAPDPAPEPDPAMDALYQSLRVTEPPLLEQTAEGDIEVIAADMPPQTLPKCLTEPWDDKDSKGSASKDDKSGAAAKSGLFAPLGRIFKKTLPKAS